MSVIELDERRPHNASPIGCRICSYTWVGVFPAILDGLTLECPSCGHFQTMIIPENMMNSELANMEAKEEWAKKAHVKLKKLEAENAALRKKLEIAKEALEYMHSYDYCFEKRNDACKACRTLSKLESKGGGDEA